MSVPPERQTPTHTVPGPAMSIAARHHTSGQDLKIVCRAIKHVKLWAKHARSPMLQGAIPVSSQSTPEDIIDPLQQSLAQRLTLWAADPQPEPPHCGHSATQHTPSFSRPERPLLMHIESDGSRGDILLHTSNMWMDSTKNTMVQLHKTALVPCFWSINR